MAKNKRKLSNQDLEELKKIEDLIITTKHDDKEKQQESKINKKQALINVGDINVLINEINFTSHSIQRAKERFNMDETHAVTYIRSRLSQASYIGVVADEDSGKPSHLFANGRTAFHLSLDLKNIITVYKCEKVTYEPIKNKVLDLHKKKFNRYAISEKAKQRKLDQLRLEADVQIAECNLRKHKTRSESVRLACEARVNAINQTLTEYQKEIEMIHAEKRRIARSMISVL
jgi:hypothetical protein